MLVLEHHGIKGQKWGVRRYQNKDGSLTNEGRKKVRARNNIKRNLKTKDIVENIVASLNTRDRKLLGMNEDEKEYLTTQQGEYVVKRFIEKHKDVPVAFLDIFGDGEYGNIAIAVNSNYKGQGYGSKLGKKASDYIDKHMSQYRRVDWATAPENIASQRLAEKNNFKRNKEYDDDKYMYYSRYPNRNKKR